MNLKSALLMQKCNKKAGICGLAVHKGSNMLHLNNILCSHEIISFVVLCSPRHLSGGLDHSTVCVSLYQSVTFFINYDCWKISGCFQRVIIKDVQRLQYRQGGHFSSTNGECVFFMGILLVHTQVTWDSLVIWLLEGRSFGPIVLLHLR